MTFRWPSKDPDETVDYSMDWSRYLNDQATIDTVTWFVNDGSNVKTNFNTTNQIVNNLQFVAKTNTSTVATINLAQGTVNNKYTLFCQILDTSGTIAERSVVLPIKEN
tara:strand:+ start:46 stop:369 length:324 start_codon:yes stop_codon:yes gene_type:complete